jgi:acid phosphatase
MSIHHLTLAACLAATLSNCAPSITRDPRNLSELKVEVKAYVDSGDYARDLAAVAAPAKSWIDRRARSHGGKTAVVFDIDETTLSNFEHMVEADWGYQPVAWDAWMATSRAPAIEPMREVYQTARANNVAVFFITGRTEKDRSATERNLRAQGMGDFVELILRPNGNKSPAALYKTAERKRITGLGYTIIGNFGDQQTDLDGGYAERAFKLPNPFYLIP